MKSTEKGNQYEREVRDIHLAQGWIVEGQHRKVSWIRDKKTGMMKMIMMGRDLFGCDLITKKQGCKTKWIQVSTIGQKSSKQRQVLMFPWTLEHEDVELWLRIEGKRAFRVFRYVSAGMAAGMGLDAVAQFVECEQQDCVKVEKGAKREKNTVQG